MKKLLDEMISGTARAEYIEVGPNVHLHITDAGEGRPIWTQRKDFPYNLPKSAVDDLIALNFHDRPKLLSNFAKIFSATETSLNEGIGNWLNGIGLSASFYATAQCLI